MHNQAKWLTGMLQKAYCMSLQDFAIAFDKPENDTWVKEKFPVMGRDFAKFFCELDSVNQKRFIDYHN